MWYKVFSYYGYYYKYNNETKTLILTSERYPSIENMIFYNIDINNLNPYFYLHYIDQLKKDSKIAFTQYEELTRCYRKDDPEKKKIKNRIEF